MRTEHNWFPTYTGIKFFPADPRPEDIRIEDIAHALSMQCRFAGHVKEFYSVAQHSVIVSQNVPPHLALAGLLHDAAEAYCQDIISPLKRTGLFKAHSEIEDNLLVMIFDKFGLPFWALPENQRLLKEADLRALMTERRDVCCSKASEYDWHVDAEPFDEKILSQSPYAAKGYFLRRFEELTR